MTLTPSTEWAYCKRIDITDTGNVSADYQMKLTIYSGIGHDNVSSGYIYCNNLCKNFPDDIRFGTTRNPATATQMEQWIESSDASEAVMWVKCVAANTFYLFIGNSNASQESDGDNTFNYFDHFDDDDWASDWSLLQPVGAIITESNSSITLHPDGNAGHIIVYTDDIVDTSDIAIEYRANLGKNGWWSGVGIRQVSTAYTVFRAMTFPRAGDDFYLSRFAAGASAESKIVDTDNVTSGWGRMTAILVGDGTGAGKLELIDQGTGETQNKTFTNTPGGDRLSLISQGKKAEVTGEYDWIAIRKYDATEPSWSSFGNWVNLLPRHSGTVGLPHII